MVECLDTSVGRLRAALERLPERNAWLIFTSDNGGFEERRLERPAKVVGREASKETYHITSNRPLRGGKGRLYEGGLRVPLVFWRPAMDHVGTCSAPVIGTDLAPTLLALADCTPLELCDGVDLSPLLGGGTTLARDRLYFHFPHQYSQSAMREGNEKLVFNWRDEKCELYDLAGDPGEDHDLAGERPERVAALRSELFRWLDSVAAGRPTHVR
jgi:arylsulfatase A-like enzyme